MAQLVVSEDNLVGGELSYGSGSNPAELQGVLDNLGGSEDSTELQLFLVAYELGVGGVAGYDDVQIAILNDTDTGIDWRIAPDVGGVAGTYTDGPLDLGDITINGATPFWCKAVLANDGSVPTNRYTTPKIGLNYTEVPV